jgi:hypothetical protein
MPGPNPSQKIKKPGLSKKPGSALCHESSARQELLLGGGELFVAQHAGGVQLRQLLQLGGQVRAGRWCRCRWRGRGRVLLLLRLRVSYPLLIDLILLRLRSRSLTVVFLLLVMMNGTRRPGNHSGSGSGPHQRRSSSSHHVTLLELAPATAFGDRMLS